MNGGAAGNLRSLLALLRSYGPAVEADLQRFYNVDYRDRWRFDDNGSRRLTLRRLWVLVSHLPPDSATMNALRDGETHWTVEAHLLDDLRIVMASSEKRQAKPHTNRPKPSARRRADSPARQMRLRAARRRARERRAKIEAGEL